MADTGGLQWFQLKPPLKEQIQNFALSEGFGVLLLTLRSILLTGCLAGDMQLLHKHVDYQKCVMLLWMVMSQQYIDEGMELLQLV